MFYNRILFFFFEKKDIYFTYVMSSEDLFSNHRIIKMEFIAKDEDNPLFCKKLDKFLSNLYFQKLGFVFENVWLSNYPRKLDLFLKPTTLNNLIFLQVLPFFRFLGFTTLL